MKKYITNVMFDIRRKMPESLKKVFRPIWHKWNIKINEDTKKNLGEYYGQSQQEIMRLLKSAGQLNADFWRCYNPKTAQEVKKFYEDTPFYVLNLIFWHGTKYQRDLREEFFKLAEGNVLDYGGGAGDLCVKIAKKGLKVDYADVEGKTFDFARWLFSKNNRHIEMINLSKGSIVKHYDTIFCIDVIEHVTNPKETLENFVNHLHNKGKLIITALHPDISESVPMHFELNFNPEEYLKSLGMRQTDQPFVWIKDNLK